MSWLLSLLASLASEATQQQWSIIHGNHQCAAQQQQLWRTGGSSYGCEYGFHLQQPPTAD